MENIKTLYQTANFELVEYEGIGRNNTPYKALEVFSHGLAEKHVVRINLNNSNWSPGDGKPFKYKYKNAEVSHGMRCACDTLNETIEYIGVLTEAVVFINNTIEMIRNW